MSLGVLRINRHTGRATQIKDGKDRATCIDCGAQIVVTTFTGPLDIEGEAEERTYFRVEELL